MRFLDMTPYTPFRPMGQSCRTRLIRKKTVRWVKPEPRETRDRRFVVRLLAQADIEAAAELWRHGYPELYGSSHDFMFYSKDYDARMAMVPAVIPLLLVLLAVTGFGVPLKGSFLT